MAPRPKRRDRWRETPAGTWTLTIGRRGGITVRLFQNWRNGPYYVDVHRPGRSRDRRTLGTCDRAEADRLGRLEYAQLVTGVPTSASPPPRVVRLSEVCDRFLKECPTFLDNARSGRTDARLRLRIIRAAIGDGRDVRTLTVNDVRQYEARRRAGGIRVGPKKVSSAVRQRSVQADVKLLKQVLSWACSVTDTDGRPWLDRNPIEKVSVRAESDVRRPVASMERFEATRTQMRLLRAKYIAEISAAETALARRRAERRRACWIRAELGLVLLEGTGRRRGAIMGLRWSDIDFASGRIRWAAEFDKKRRSAVVQYPAALLQDMRALQRELGAVGGFVFPGTKDPKRPAPRELLSQWIRAAEELAKLPKLEGGTCHPYRRKWRSERSHHPLKAVAVAGGWTDYDTMIRCYDIPDDADVLAVTSEPRKRREAPAPAERSEVANS